tara:strand:+ start:84 stop:317 length:234 start_codon:yes stop_codon:yes gene_type:complete
MEFNHMEAIEHDLAGLPLQRDSRCEQVHRASGRMAVGAIQQTMHPGAKVEFKGIKLQTGRPVTRSQQYTQAPPGVPT